MKLKRKIKTNVILSFVITLLVLSIIDLSFVPQTNSKYKTAETTKLQYSASLYQLYRFGETYTYQLPKPTPDLNPELTADKDNKTFDIKFSFLRQNASAVSDVNNENKDNYTITAPNNCTVNGKKVDIVSFNYPSKVDENSRVNEEVSVTLHCDANAVPPENGQLELNINVKEQVGGENPFNYTDYSFIIKEDYYNDVMGISLYSNPYTIVYGTDYLTTDDVSKKFLEWVNWYIEKNGYSSYEKQIKDYLHITTQNEVDSVDTSYIVSNGTNFKKEILGFKRSGDRRTSYTYEFDNLLGYIRTAESSMKKNNMYFYTDKEETINQAFDYYLKEAGFTEDSTTEDGKKIIGEITLIKDYLNRRGGISSVILKNNRIYGVSYSKSEHRLYLSNKLLEYAESLKDVIGDIVEFNSLDGMMLNFNGIFESKSFISNDITGVDGRIDGKFLTQFYSKLFINNDDEFKDNYKSFVNYVTMKDETNGYYIVLKAYSDYEKSKEKRNIYYFQTLSFPVDMVVSFDNVTDDELDIILKLPKTANIEGVSTLVDRTLAESIFYNTAMPTLAKSFPDISKEDSIISEQPENWVITFTVSKGYNTLIPSAEETVSDDNSSNIQNNSEALESVQGTIDKVTNAAASAAEEMKESNVEEDATVSIEENKGLAMISSIMKFLLVKE